MKVRVMDNDIRWRSVATIVEYGLGNHDGIDMYCCEPPTLEADTLLEEDWEELHMVQPIISVIDITGYQDLGSIFL